MEAIAILEKLDGLGVKVSVTGDRLRLEPGSLVPAELMEELRRRKKEVISFLKLSERPKPSGAEVDRRLQAALERKEKEIVSDKRYLFSLDCACPELTEQGIVSLEAHIVEIRRYLKEGGALKLPQCYRQHEWTCLLAMRGFYDCAMLPECGFSLRL